MAAQRREASGGAAIAPLVYDLREILRRQDIQHLAQRRLLLSGEIAACAEALDFSEIRSMLDEIDAIEAELAELEEAS
jgi:hypothetical protein